MRQVTKEVFFDKINHMDVVVSAVGNYPYTSEFQTRGRQLVGFAKPVLNEYGRLKYPVEDDYFLVD